MHAYLGMGYAHIYMRGHVGLHFLLDGYVHVWGGGERQLERENGGRGLVGLK